MNNIYDDYTPRTSGDGDQIIQQIASNVPESYLLPVSGGDSPEWEADATAIAIQRGADEFHAEATSEFWTFAGLLVVGGLVLVIALDGVVRFVQSRRNR